MNDLDLLEVVSRSCQPLRYIRRWISRKPLETEVCFQKTTNQKWHMVYQMVTWPMTLRDPQRCCEAVQSAILATAWLLVFFGGRIECVTCQFDTSVELVVCRVDSKQKQHSLKPETIVDLPVPSATNTFKTNKFIFYCCVGPQSLNYCCHSPAYGAIL